MYFTLVDILRRRGLGQDVEPIHLNILHYMNVPYNPFHQLIMYSVQYGLCTYLRYAYSKYSYEECTDFHNRRNFNRISLSIVMVAFNSCKTFTNKPQANIGNYKLVKCMLLKNHLNHVGLYLRAVK